MFGNTNKKSKLTLKPQGYFALEEKTNYGDNTIQYWINSEY